MNALDHGVKLDDIAAGFAASAEFTQLYGAHPSHAQLVAGLYQNVLHRTGEADGVKFWTGALDSGAATAAQVLAAFGESAENQAQVATLVAQGIPFVPVA